MNNPTNRLILTIYLSQVFCVLGLIMFWDFSYLLYSIIGVFLFVSLGQECYMHRYLAHQTYKVSRVFEIFLHICSIYALQGSAINWAAYHVTHHKYSDITGDPHPAKEGWKSWLWLNELNSSNANISTIKRLAKNKFYKFTREYYLAIYLISLIFVSVINIKITIYLFLLPAMWAFHASGFVTVILHRYGYRNFNLEDTSKNLLIANFIVGNPLHNNHHARPGNYNDAIKENEFDIHGLLIHHVLRKL